MAILIGFFKMIKKIGSDDPRRIIHSLKVSIALTLVSAFYYVNPVFNGLGQSVIWAVLTVVLIMEFTVGAAVSKGLNRTLATFLAGVTGIAAHRCATLFGEKGEPVVLGVLVFVVAASATFVRFVPELKARYDYGVLIFILTFCMVTVSSYRKDKVLTLAKERFCTIAIGVLISFFISILVFPVWAGDDLHGLAVGNMEKLAKSIEAMSVVLEGKKPSSSLDAHRSVLHSKSSEDSLANLVWWEPPHGRFRYRHPWDQYPKIGLESHRCAHLMEALNTQVNRLITSNGAEFGTELLVACTEINRESCKALREAAAALRSMRAPCAGTGRCAASEQMKISLLENNCEDIEQTILVAPIVSAMVEILGCVRAIITEAEELARRAHFESSDQDTGRKGAEKPLPAEAEGFDHVTIEIGE